MRYIIIIILMAVALLYLQDRGYRVQVEDLEKATGSLRGEITLRDAQIVEKETYILAKQDSLQIVQEQLIIKQAQLRQLEAALDTLPDKVVDIPVEESYNALQEIYPTGQELKYPFSESQVQDIYLTFLQKRQKGLINSNLRFQIIDYQKQVNLFEDVTTKQEQTILIMQENREDLEEIIVNKDAVIGYQRDEFLRERRIKRVWMVVAGVAIAGAIYF